MISFRCPICDEPLEAPEALRGENLECPNCGELVGIHGVNSRLTPPCDTVHTEQPIYAPQHWFICIAILACIILALVFSVNNSNWEKQNQETILALCNESTTLIESDNLSDGIRKYTELEELINNQVITREANLDAIAKAREKFEFACELIKWRKQEMLACQNKQNELAMQNADSETETVAFEMPALVSKAVKEYKELLTKIEPEKIQEEIIGKWLAPASYGNGDATIIKIGDKYYFRRYTNNEMVLENEVAEKESLLPGRSFIDLQNISWGILYRINNEGDLEFWENSGYISTATAVKN